MTLLIKGYVLGVLASKDCERLIRIAAVRGLKTVSLMQKRQLTEVVSEIDPTVLLILGQLWFVESIDFGVWRDLPIPPPFTHQSTRMPTFPVRAYSYSILEIVTSPEKRRLLPKRKKRPCGTIRTKGTISFCTIILINQNSSTHFQRPATRQSLPSLRFFSRLDKRQSFGTLPLSLQNYPIRPGHP